MSVTRIIGVALIVIGIAALAWGGVFWTDRDTVVDIGELEVTTENREGVALPPVVGMLAIVGGAILLFVPARRRI
jgi:hypothetical protein